MKTRTFALAALVIIAGLAVPAAARQASDDSATTTAATTPNQGDGATRADDERMVCERVKVIGSNKVERICKTARQRREEREGAKYRAGQQSSDRMMQSRSVCANTRCNGP